MRAASELLGDAIRLGPLHRRGFWVTAAALVALTAAAASLSAQPVGSEFQVNTYTTNEQERPSVAAAADGDFVVVWQSLGQDGSSNGVFGQRYASDGSAVGSEFQVNTYTTSSQEEPSVAMDADGDFIVV